MNFMLKEKRERVKWKRCLSAKKTKDGFSKVVLRLEPLTSCNINAADNRCI